MTMINRRHFLANLAALGAAIVLPEQATSTEVDEAWEQVLLEPWFFEVDDARTILEPDGQEPKICSDVYDCISLSHIETSDDLIDEVEQYQELRSHFASLAASELEDVEMELDGDKVNLLERARLLALQAVLQDQDDGWQDWIRLAGQAGLPRFKSELEEWLASPVDWMQNEFWPRGWSSQGKALSFFQQLDGEIVDGLGVVIVEGDHPGSSYYAAELHLSIDHANQTALLLELPFRFREAV